VLQIIFLGWVGNGTLVCYLFMSIAFNCGKIVIEDICMITMNIF
jgi:hypothetical protein